MTNTFVAILKDGVQARSFWDGQNEEWDILNDEYFEQAVKTCDTIDHRHFVLPWQTFLHAEHPE